MQKITPNLWFDKEAKEAAEFYTSLFPDSKITVVSTLHNTPSGNTEIVYFELTGQPFVAISAGPEFKFNPSVSFILNFDPSKDANARENLDKIWEELSKGGDILIALDKYTFSERYGWVQDKYGVSWQLMLSDPEGEERPFIIPTLLFAGDNVGRAEEAINFYTSIFKNSKIGSISHYPAGMPARHDDTSHAGGEPDKEGTVQFADFLLNDTWFAAMDSARQHNFTFNEAISFIVYCKDQSEIDYYWDKLSAVPESEQCGWLKDKFGVSWQIVPTAMDEMIQKGTPEEIDRVTQTFLPMKKLIIADLEKAYKGT